MSFNISKCKSMLLTHKRDPFCPTMMLNNQSLEIVKYLGVVISSNLCWSQHVKEICKKEEDVRYHISQLCSKHFSQMASWVLFMVC